MLKHYTPLKNQSGSSVIAVLSAVIVLGVFLQTVGFDKIAQSNFITSSSRMKTARDGIAHQIENFSVLPATFRNSLLSADNSALKNCILGTGSSPCAGDGTEYPLNMYAPTSTSPTIPKMAGAGPVNNSDGPALYNTKGELCQTGATTATAACPFEVYATFKAKCASGATSCATAESINVHYIVRIPETLFSGLEFKDRLLLSSVDKVASSIPRTTILPVPYGYVPNSIYSTTTISLTPGTITTVTTAATATYEEALLAVRNALPGSDATTIASITDRLYNHWDITNLGVISALAAFWIQNPEVADEIAYRTNWRQENRINYTPTVTEITSTIEAVSWMTDTYLAKNLVEINGGLDCTIAHAISNALTGITDRQSIYANAFARVTDPVQAQLISAGLIGAGLTDLIARQVAYGVVAGNVTDLNALKTYVSVIKDAGITDPATAFTIVKSGITDITFAKNLQTDVIARAATYTTPTTTTGSPTATSTTTTTTTTTVPVSTTSACTSSSTCGTTIGI